MPTVLIIGAFRFFFYSNEHLPEHVHVESGEGVAKYSLRPVELVKSSGLNASELSKIRKLVLENQVTLLSKWDEYFNN
ncbi:protein of unknown function [Reichenbachiella faecimaris]|uniref:DUF4160 domain-containing protein n=1 Tax=Reichenbachiella faecimaris TaxID=692418 RepID=A0A1W2GR47_REIFA|nr:DUF4160 domain-containing protein [Reichenbachiella faecimaris]SMD38828.1 protein of unknown function [Reichenbachiella faecimaris]